MSRLRSRLATHSVDREAGKWLADADHALHMAMNAYRTALKGGSRSQQRRAQASIEVIRKSMRILAGVQSIGDRYDSSDPDMKPESEKVAQRRPKERKSERVE